MDLQAKVDGISSAINAMAHASGRDSYALTAQRFVNDLKERIEELERRWDDIPWEEIEARRAVFAEHPAQFPIDLVLMDRLLALREQGGRE